MSDSSDMFSIYQKIHFIGIGGIGISALARILQFKGHHISGSDQTESELTKALKNEGIDLRIGHLASHLPNDCNLVIITKAIPKNNPELLEAEKRGVKIMTYPQAVGLLTQNYQTISVCGTHGKTTTTSLIGVELIANQQDPTIIVGSLVKELGNRNDRIGKSKHFLLESCEYQESFLNYHPQIIVLNNIEEEHLDYFGTKERYIEAFEKFLQQLRPNGLLIANGDDENIQYVLSKVKPPKVILFGLSEKNNYVIKSQQIFHQKKLLCELNLAIPGQHNILNATAALILSEYLKLDLTKSLNALNQFVGAARRFEIKGKIGKTTIIDDYGHTPTEIKSTLRALRDKYGKQAKVLCVFQPHQYSRTYQFLDQFAQAFQDVDQVYIPNIYRTRDSDEDVQKISPQILVNKINQIKPNLAVHTENFDNTFQLISENYQNFDLIITMGAGDITNLSSRLLQLS